MPPRTPRRSRPSTQPAPPPPASLSSASFRSLVESAPDGVIVADAGGCMILANHQIEVHFGYTHEQLIGGELELLLPTRFRTRHVQHREKYFAESPATRPMGTGLRLFGLRRDGTEFPVEISLSPLVTLTETFVISLISDVTLHADAEQDAVIAHPHDHGIGIPEHEPNRRAYLLALYEPRTPESSQ